MRALLLPILLALAPRPLRAEGGAALSGFDVFGSTRVSAQEIQGRYGAKIAGYVEAFVSRDLDSAEELKKGLEEDLRAKYGFAWAQLSMIQYYTPGRPRYATLDLVEPADKKVRMPFFAPPQEAHENLEAADELIRLWRDYEKAGWTLMNQGVLQPDKISCPVYHCIFGFNDPRLAAFGKRFSEEVPRHEGELIEVLHKDFNPANRAVAAFLLAHMPDGNRLVQALLYSIQDPGSEVRNNVLRVLAAVAAKHSDIAVPLDPILEALDFPTTADRNKASAVLAGLAQNPKLQPEILKKAGPLLLALLKLDQPNNHDFAYQILKICSGQSFPERDYAAWTSYLAQNSK